MRFTRQANVFASAFIQLFSILGENIFVNFMYLARPDILNHYFGSLRGYVAFKTNINISFFSFCQSRAPCALFYIPCRKTMPQRNHLYM